MKILIGTSNKAKIEGARKAFEEYKKLHPNSEMTYTHFKNNVYENGE